MAARHLVPGMLEGHSVDGRRRRGLVLPHVRERRLALELRRHHLRLHGLALGRRRILVIVVVIVRAAIEVGRTLVLVWSAMLYK